MSRVNRRLVPELAEAMSFEGDSPSNSHFVNSPPVILTANAGSTQQTYTSSPDAVNSNSTIIAKQKKKLLIDLCSNSSQESLNSDVHREPTTTLTNTHPLSSTASIAPPSDVSEVHPLASMNTSLSSDVTKSNPLHGSPSSQDLPAVARTTPKDLPVVSRTTPKDLPSVYRTTPRVSRESTPDDPTADPITPRSNGHRRSSSRSSDPDTQASQMNGGSAMSMDFEKMRVSLILKDEDEDYELDDLSIVGRNPPGGEIPNYSERSTPPSSLQNITEAGPEVSSYDWSRYGENAAPSGYAGVPIRDGRRTPTNGGLSDSSGRQSFESASPPGMTRVSSSGKISGSDKKKKPYWYNVLSPTYKSRSEDFKRIFKDIPADERLIVDYSCALQKDILVHGRIYITQSYICFYANIFRWETVLTLKCKDLTTMTKEKTARVIPNAIQICNKDDKYFFTSFGTRDKTYLMMFRVWQNALADNPMSAQELWQWVHYSYGEELGLNSSDEDYVQPSTEDEHMFQSRVQHEECMVAAMEGAGVADKEDLDSLAEPLTNGDLSSPPGLTGEPTELKEADQTDNIVHKPPPIKVHPVDGTSPTDLPTDLTDTSEEDEDEVVCSGHEHLDIDVIESVYNFSVDKLFEMIFTDSQLYRHFTEVKKTKELVQSEWSEEVDSEGDQHRVISYTLSLNYSIGPKTSPATEKQILRSDSKPGAFYLVDTECINSSIPYGDNFYVVNRYCLNRITPNRCRLKISSAIKYRKSVWGLVKNFIEKNVTNGILDSFTCISDLLQQESVRLVQQASLAPPAGKKKVLRRRRNVSDRTQSIKRPGDVQITHSQGTPVKSHPQKTQGMESTDLSSAEENGLVLDPTTIPSPPGLDQPSNRSQSQALSNSPVSSSQSETVCDSPLSPSQSQKIYQNPVSASQSQKLLETNVTANQSQKIYQNPNSASQSQEPYQNHVNFSQSLKPCDSPVWLEITGDICKKASKRLRQLEVLSRSGCMAGDMVTYYVSMIRSILDYAAPLWHRNLTEEEEECVENIQERALGVIYPGFSYSAALVVSNLDRLSERRRVLYEAYFKQFQERNESEADARHTLSDMLRTSAGDDQQVETPYGASTLQDIIGSGPVQRRTNQDKPTSTHGLQRPPASEMSMFEDSSRPIYSQRRDSTRHGVKTREEPPPAITADVLVQVICVVLIILAVFNGLLYYKLWGLEQRATMLFNSGPDVWKNIQEQPKSQEDWLNLINKQQSLHDTEIERWKDVLSTSVKLMQSMQKTLQTLEEGINSKYTTGDQAADTQTDNLHTTDKPKHDEH